MNYEEMREMEKSHVCSECHGELTTIWDGENEVHRLCCGVNHTHNGFQRRLGTQQALQRGQLDKELGSGAQKDLEERARRSEAALSLLPKEDIATKKALTIMDIGELVTWADRIALSAHLGHVCLYHGKPYVTIDGYYYLLNKQKRDMFIGTRPMSGQERIDYEVPEGDFAWVAESWQGKRKLPTVGIGIVTGEELTTKSLRNPEHYAAPVVHSHPQRMAEKRAEWQLLRKLLPLEVLDEAWRTIRTLEDELRRRDSEEVVE